MEGVDLEEQIRRGAQIIREGGVVAFPTETVYGLGANAFDEMAVAKIFELKGRPFDNPLIVHISRKDDIWIVASDVPDCALILADAFWPGPLTMVLPRNPSVPDIVSAGLSTVAVRMPSHPIALKLIELAGIPVAAPSANPSGRPSATKYQHVRAYFGDKVFAIEGETQIGIESTVIDLTVEPPVILRPGALEVEKISEMIGPVQSLKSDEVSKPKSPGVKYAHYKPYSYLILLTERSKIISIRDILREFRDDISILFVMTYSYDQEFQKRVVDTLGRRISFIFAGRDEREVAKNLFDILILKGAEYDLMIFEGVREEGIGLGVMNRLKKASDMIV